MFCDKKLKPGKQRHNKLAIYGFDIETCNKNREFLCASLYKDDNNKWIFYSPEEFIKFIKSGLIKNAVIAATNLSFDFFGTFFSRDECQRFNFLFRGSNLLFARTYMHDGDFRSKWHKDFRNKIVFLDTMNYARIGVNEMGEILRLPKLSKPEFLGDRPVNDMEWMEMTDYNMRDAEISCKFVKFLYSVFDELGATPKMTIASTAMSLFRNKFLKEEYDVHHHSYLKKEFLAYYGGRTEAFSRGKIRNYKFYDVNSLYPAVMRMSFPNPDSMQVCRNDMTKINKYPGISHVEVFVPESDYPVLPYRTKDKLLFPHGTFAGWYVHEEIRHAVSHGAVVKKIYETHYYTKSCYPFKEYVDALYSLRLKYKQEGSAMEYVVKILLNSLYGKFAQRYLGRDNWQPIESIKFDELDNCEIVGRFVRIVKDGEPSNFCFPLWAAHITAYARIYLHKLMMEAHPVYVDTDSLMTRQEMPVSNDLGGLKMEGFIVHGFIVKPKMYALYGDFGVKKGRMMTEKVKIKGLGIKMLYDNFDDFMQNPKIVYDKFATFKESVRRGFLPNEIHQVSKEFSLNDDKRLWPDDFSSRFEVSRPVELIDGISMKEVLKEGERYEAEKLQEEMEVLERTDTFDSIGHDIGRKEFLENEVFMELQ